MERISRTELFMNIAYMISKRGTCGRLQVGCIIVKENRIISTGYNGPVKDAAHCNEFSCNVNESCTRAVHAEANAIYWAAKEGTKLKRCTIYCTHSPCEKCAEAIIQSGIKTVIYNKDFRDKLPLVVLKKAGVEVIKQELYLSI